jgi:hypothetical protein
MQSERAVPPSSVLDVSVTAAVLIALVTLAFWYLFFGATGPGPRVVI